MKTIPLTRGKVAIVDDADYALVSAYKWNAAKRKNCWYAQGGIGANKRILMHRLLMGFPELEVDHINGDGLDNRRANLRPATRAQNTRNNGPQAGTSSQFKGVSWVRARSKWFACIKIDGKTISLGRHESEIAAARAYDAAALKAWGEFARLNNV